MNTDTKPEALPFSIVLYFGTETDRREFVEVVRAAKPEGWMKMEESVSEESKAPVAELSDTFPVELFFSTERDRDDFVALVKEAKPGMVARQL